MGEADSFIYDLPVKGKLIRVDIDPARFSDAFPATVAVFGDAKAACEMLLAALKTRKDKKSVSNIDAELNRVRAVQKADYPPIDRQHINLLNALREKLPDAAVSLTFVFAFPIGSVTDVEPFVMFVGTQVESSDTSPVSTAI